MSAGGDGPRDADARAEAFRHCERMVREADPEHFLAALFAPADLRPYLHALAAYNLEIARVREVAAQPIAGEIRLQWWRDAIAGEGHGDVEGHPVAAALRASLAECALPTAPLLAMSEARIFDLYDDPMPTLADLEGYAGETRGALVQLGALVLARGRDPGTGTAAGHAGVARTLAAVLEAFPLHARRGQVYVPADVLARHGATPDDVRAGSAPAAVAAALSELADHAAHHLERTLSALPGTDPAAAAAFLPALALRPRLRRLSRGAAAGMPPRGRLATQLDVWRAARRLRGLFARR